MTALRITVGGLVFTARYEDEAAWTASLDRIRGLHPARLYPGHGEPIEPQ